MVTAVLAMLMLPAGAMLGQNNNENGVYQYEQPTEQQQQTSHMPGIHRANELIGMDLVNSQGEKIGEIEEIVLTEQLDKVDYVAVSVDDSEHDHHALSLDQLEIRDDQVAVNIDKETLLQTNGFSDDNWPEMKPEGQGRETMTAQREQSTENARETPQEGMTGQRAQRQPVSEFRFRRVSELSGMDVVNLQDENLGNLEELMLDSREGVIAYGIVSFGGFLGIGENLSPIPWEAVQFQPDEEHLVADATSEDLEALSFSDDEWPDFTDREYSQRVFAQYNQEPYWQIYGYDEPQGQLQEQPQKPMDRPMEQREGEATSEQTR